MFVCEYTSYSLSSYTVPRIWRIDYLTTLPLPPCVGAGQGSGQSSSQVGARGRPGQHVCVQMVQEPPPYILYILSHFCSCILATNAKSI